jgi:MtN3 and saliva related transmembrane protein
MQNATLIGLVAGALTTLAWLPQVVRAFRSRSTRDFAWSWFAMFGSGVAIWVVYGILAASPAVIATNVLTLALVVGLGALKAKHSFGTRTIGAPAATVRRADARTLSAHLPGE